MVGGLFEGVRLWELRAWLVMAWCGGVDGIGVEGVGVWLLALAVVVGVA